MKILIYSEYFMPEPGGVQSIVMVLARGLIEWSGLHPGEERIEVTVATRTAETTPEDKKLGFRLVRRPSLGKLLNLIREADVVHLAGPAMLPLLLSLLLNKVLVIEHHGFHAACPTGLLFYEPEQMPCPGYFMAREYEKCMKCQEATGKSAAQSRKTIFSTKIRRMLTNRASINIMPTEWLGTILQLRRMRTVHHGMTEPAYLSAHKKGLPPNSSSAPTASSSNFAYHGRLVSTKGVKVLLHAASKLHQLGLPFKIRVIGGGQEMPQLKSMTATIENQIEFLGHVPDQNLEEALEEFPTIVMPSLGGEVFGLVASENMLRGKLLIASDLGALQEVIGDTGLSFPAGDSAALAQRMQQVISAPALPADLGQKARVRALRLFGQESMIQRHIQVYREAISLERPRTRP
jgi:glycosyltransferase involved in cell wall biosynthesis